IVLVPLDHRAVFHRRVLDRHHFIQTPPRDDEAADVLAQMAWEADEITGKLQRAVEMAIRGIEPGFADVLLVDALRSPAPDGACENVDGILRQTHRLADVAQRAARAITDHRRRQPGADAAIA